MKVEVIQDAHVLIPNPEHKNFTRTGEVIPKGQKLEGHIKIIKGMKAGEPFEYNLFYTKDNQIIYIKNIKPMEKTEVTLGADSATTATKISLPNQSNLGKRPLIGALIGVGAGFGVAKLRKIKSHKWIAVHVIIGGLVGFVAGKYLQSHRNVTVTPSK